MMKESEKLIKGSVNGKYVFIVHDDLVLLTAKETITWMRENNYLHCWLLPINAFQNGKPYYGLHVGDIPKLVSLYNILNRDILHSLVPSVD